MSTFSANRFALLSDGGSDDEAPRTKVPAAVASQPSKPIPVPTQKPKSAPAAGRGRGGDYPARGGARNVFREDREAQPGGAGGEDGREPRGERRGRGGPRGGRGGPGRGRGGRGGAKGDRPDRHSQTGVTDTEKKIASGWGAEEGKSELQAENEGYGDAKADASIPGTPGANGATEAPVTEAPTAEAAAPAEEEDNTKTLDEFLAERAAAARIGGSLEGRQANEGADDSQWKDGVQLLKADQEDADWFMGKAQSKKVATANAKKTKTFIDVEPQGYRPPRTERGGRGGGRGGERGGRGRGEGRGRGRGEFRGGAAGGFRGGRGGASRELNTEDSSAFPSLS